MATENRMRSGSWLHQLYGYAACIAGVVFEGVFRVVEQGADGVECPPWPHGALPQRSGTGIFRLMAQVMSPAALEFRYGRQSGTLFLLELSGVDSVVGHRFAPFLQCAQCVARVCAVCTSAAAVLRAQRRFLQICALLFFEPIIDIWF